MPAPACSGFGFGSGKSPRLIGRGGRISLAWVAKEAMPGRGPAVGCSVALRPFTVLVSSSIRHPDQRPQPLDADAVEGTQKRGKRRRIIGIKDTTDRECAQLRVID